MALSISWSVHTRSPLARNHLIVNKRAAGRDHDLVDVKWLDASRED
jgi:hypothetical protein